MSVCLPRPHNLITFQTLKIISELENRAAFFLTSVELCLTFRIVIKAVLALTQCRFADNFQNEGDFYIFSVI